MLAIFPYSIVNGLWFRRIAKALSFLNLKHFHECECECEYIYSTFGANRFQYSLPPSKRLHFTQSALYSMKCDRSELSWKWKHFFLPFATANFLTKSNSVPAVISWLRFSSCKNYVTLWYGILMLGLQGVGFLSTASNVVCFTLKSLLENSTIKYATCKFIHRHQHQHQHRVHGDRIVRHGKFCDFTKPYAVKAKIYV